MFPLRAVVVPSFGGRMKYAQTLTDRVSEYRDRRARAGLDSVTTVRGRHPDFDDVRDAIRAAGTDSLSHFGNDYAHEGGLSLQQNPDEFAALCLFLEEQADRDAYLEIGSASGGACVFLYERLGFREVISLDDGNHPRAAEQAANFARIPGIQRYVGDSHAPAAGAFLREVLTGPIDVAFIDGDHSYAGVVQDVQLVRPVLRPGGIVIFHDTVAVPDVKRAWRESTRHGDFSPVAEFIGFEHPLGIGVARKSA
jgi:predicted O-methyltransferase YrrM